MLYYGPLGESNIFFIPAGDFHVSAYCFIGWAYVFFSRLLFFSLLFIPEVTLSLHYAAPRVSVALLIAEMLRVLEISCLSAG